MKHAGEDIVACPVQRRHRCQLAHGAEDAKLGKRRCGQQALVGIDVHVLGVVHRQQPYAIIARYFMEKAHPNKKPAR